MTWEQAKKILSRGKSVRRELWDSSIRKDKKELHWNITPDLARSCNDDGSDDCRYRSYEV